MSVFSLTFDTSRKENKLDKKTRWVTGVLVCFSIVFLPACKSSEALEQVLTAAGLKSTSNKNYLNCQAPAPDGFIKHKCQKKVRASQLMKNTSCISAKHFQEFTCLIADTSFKFCDVSKDSIQKPFNTSIVLQKSNITVDCNSRTIDHGYPTVKTKRPGIRSPKTRSLNNIAIKNCTIQNTGFSGIELMRHFRGAELNQILQGHQFIRIENTQLFNTKVGVYVGQASKAITMDGIMVKKTLNSGVYIDADSKDVAIRNSHIEGSEKREGISIDSSSHNIVQNNVIKNHDKGAINLYKNCGELQGVVCPIKRVAPANNNIILNNDIEGDINVAWRQNKFYIGGFCKDLNGRAGNYRDDAEQNHIYKNRINCQWGDKGIVLNDANNIVHDNTFTGGSCGVVRIKEH